MTMIDARELPDGKEFSYDLCIIGSGPAGMAVASALRESSLKIAILESGGLEYEQQTQSLAAGATTGLPYPDLASTRLRFFGGTSNHWGGNVRPMDAIDFEAREWVPNSGWPITYRDLEPYYADANRFCGLPPLDAFASSSLVEATDSNPFDFDAEQSMRSQVFRTVGADFIRFGQAYRDAFRQQPNLDVYLFANVTEIMANSDANQVTGLRVDTLNGKSLQYSAKQYVLAAGGIENARLLLCSNKQQESGLGNAYDLVGRYFMEHLTAPDFGSLIPQDPNLNLKYYKGTSLSHSSIWGVLSMRPETQREYTLPNIRFQLASVYNAFNQYAQSDAFQSLRSIAQGRYGSDVEDFGRHIAQIIAGVDEVAAVGYYRAFHHPDYPLNSVDVVFMAEQIPNANSRVHLSEERDALDMPKAVLNWQVLPEDTAGVQRAAKRFAHAVGGSGIGRFVNGFPEGGFAEKEPFPHIHHMGTTRMSEDPRRGVVDSNCRLHSVANLYVAGSSVFATCGNVNPTLTILALAFRLGERLKEQTV